MNINAITMDKDEATRKYFAAINERHADAFEYHQQCATAYDLLAQGAKLIRLSRAIQSGGLKENGLPNLAIARADRKEVFFRWRRNNPMATFDTNINPVWGRRWPGLVTTVDMGQQHTDHTTLKNADGSIHTWDKDRSGYALVPAVPADVRPENGQLKDWFILWEVDHWAEQSRIARASTDPYLLQHIGGDLYAVIAEWDLTEIEKAILEGEMQ